MKLKILLFIVTIFIVSCRNDIVTKSTPENVFLAFWQTLDENYVYFSEKNLDWDSVFSVYYPKAKAAQTDRELFNIFVKILPLLNDRHISLYGHCNFDTIGTNFYAGNNVFDISSGSPFMYDRLWVLNHNNFLVDVPDNTCDNCIKEVNLIDYLGFYKISSPLECFQHKTKKYALIFTYEFGIHNANLETMLESLKGLDYSNGLIISVLDNGGGFLQDVSNIFSLFFTGERILDNAVYKTGAGHNDFSGEVPVSVSGKGLVSENIPIMVLTGPLTYSAANLFAYAMKDLPNCTLVGKKTGGGGGSPRAVLLPNSWRLHFPYMKIFSVQGENLESPLMPDIYVKIENSEGEDYTNEEDVIIRAVEVLDSINGF